MTILNRQVLLQTLDGYSEANRTIEMERRARLRQRSDQESLAIFAELYQTWECSGQKEGGETSRMVQSRLEHHLHLRQSFEIAVRRGFH